LDNPRFARYQNRDSSVGETDDTDFATTIIFRCPLGGVSSFANFVSFQGQTPTDFR
jgi:hypothetical protein